MVDFFLAVLLEVTGVFYGGLLVRLRLCWLWFITCCFNSVDLRVLCDLLCIAACLRVCRLLVIAYSVQLVFGVL